MSHRLSLFCSFLSLFPFGLTNYLGKLPICCGNSRNLSKEILQFFIIIGCERDKKTEREVKKQKRTNGQKSVKLNRLEKKMKLQGQWAHLRSVLSSGFYILTFYSASLCHIYVERAIRFVWCNFHFLWPEATAGRPARCWGNHAKSSELGNYRKNSSRNKKSSHD